MKRSPFLLLVLLVSLSHPVLADPTIYLVRHAEKATGGDGKDPDLSEAGRARAASLAAILKDADISAVYATEFKRTQQTAQPLAQAASLTTTMVPGKETTALVAQLEKASGNVLVVGHSNTLPEILISLGVPSPPAIDEADYDDLFIVTPGSPRRMIRLHYR